MIHKRLTFIRLLVMITMVTVGMVSQALAQNFANLQPVQDGTNQNQMIQEQVQPNEMQQINEIKQIQELMGENAMQLPIYPEIIGEDSKYTLGPRDVIQISVMRHPEVSGSFGVNMEGKIQYEFVGDVEVAGKTKAEVAEVIAEELSEYIIAPEVNVKIVGYNSKVVYVIGEVGRPGKVIMYGDTITVRDALLQAGLPLLSAKSKKSIVITPTADGKPDQRKVNVHSLLYKGDLRENIVMRPGDTLYIPPTIMAKAMRTIQPVAAPVGAGSGLGRTLTTGF